MKQKPLSIAYLPGVGIIWKDPTPLQYRQALWHLQNRPPWTRDYEMINQLEATYRRIMWSRQ